MNSTSSHWFDSSSPGALIFGAVKSGLTAQFSGRITLHVVGLGIEPGSPEEFQLKAITEGGLGNYYGTADEVQLTAALQQASADPGSGKIANYWICGESLVCLGGLGLGANLVVFLVRRSKRAAGAQSAAVAERALPLADPPQEE